MNRVADRLQRLSNRIFAIPSIAQLWARVTSGRTRELVDLSAGIPFVPLSKPLADSTAALVTTGGVHLCSQPPFDMDSADGDASYRELPSAVPRADLTITHKYYNHADADRDLNIVFPMDHFRELAHRRVIRRLAPRHFGFMGHIDAQQVTVLVEQTAPEVAAKLRADGVDFAFLTPA